jgi:hypothetical protein
MKIVITSLMFSLTVAFCSSHVLVAADEQQQAAAKTTFLVIYRPGPSWLVGKPVSEQPLKEHGKYMLSLYVKGSMKLAGPLTDNAGGAVVLAVADESEAKAIVTEDPGGEGRNLRIRNAPVGVKAVGQIRQKKVDAVPDKALQSTCYLREPRRLPRRKSAVF